MDINSNWRMSRQIPVNRLPLPVKRMLKRFRSYRPSRQARQSEVGCGGNPLNQRKKTYAWKFGSEFLRSRSSISVWLKYDHPPRLQYSLIYGTLVQLARTPACHAGGHGFEPRRCRQRYIPNTSQRKSWAWKRRRKIRFFRQQFFGYKLLQVFSDVYLSHTCA